MCVYPLVDSLVGLGTLPREQQTVVTQTLMVVSQLAARAYASVWGAVLSMLWWSLCVGVGVPPAMGQ